MPAARNIAVLVVDDQQTMRAMARQVLKQLGVIDVALAASGEAALDQMMARKFDVVISDLNMPGISGAELAQKIKAHPVLKSIPVFLATSNAYRDQANDCIDHFVAKPFVLQELRDGLEQHLGKLS